MEKYYDINYLTTVKENQYFDRKSARQKPKEILPDIVAFANTEGGVLAIGIEDNGEITGFIDAKASNLDDFKNIANRLVETPVRFSTDLIKVVNSRKLDDNILLIFIEASTDRVIVTPNDTAYLRQGDESVKLKHEQRLQLAFDKGQRYFEDELIKDASVDDLDLTLLKEYSSIIGVTYDDPIKILKGRGLFKQGCITAAGILLFAKDPSIFLPQSKIKIVKYSGDKLEYGQAFNAIKEKTVFGPIPRMITESREFINTQLRDFQFLNSEGIFEIMPEYPEFAWFEGIVNALTHRNYSIYGQHITIAIFDDHLEIKSPGILPNIVTLENILTERFSRNPKIARILSEFGWVKEMNEGVNRIYREMQEFFLKSPTYSEPNHNSVLLILENNILNRQVRSIEKMKSTFDSFEKLSGDAQTLIHHMYNSGEKMTTALAADILNRGTTFTRKLLKDLSQKGYLKWHGSSPNDRNQYYLIKKD